MNSIPTSYNCPALLGSLFSLVRKVKGVSFLWVPKRNGGGKGISQAWSEVFAHCLWLQRCPAPALPDSPLYPLGSHPSEDARRAAAGKLPQASNLYEGCITMGKASTAEVAAGTRMQRDAGM